jgi:hypothetical protein
MRRFIFGFLALLASALASAAPAQAQCSGVPNANTVCAGPTSGGAGFPGFRAVVAADIPSLPLSSLAAQANLTILANITGSSNPPAADTLTAILDAILGTTRGSLIERGASTWGVITPGTTGLPFVSNGGGVDPAYQALTNAGLAAATQNTVKGAATSTAETDLAVPSCSTVNSAIQWTTNTGFGCRTTHADLVTADQTVTGGGLVTPNAQAAGNFTLDCGKVPLQWIPNTGAFTITAPALTTTNSQNCALRIINGTTAANAGAVTLAGFSGKSPGGATFATTPTVSAASVSYTNGSANIGWTANGLSLGSVVFLATTGALPTNFSTATLYYVVTTGTNQIQVSATPGGAAIVAGSAGSGTQTAYVPSIFDLVVLGIDGPVYSQWVQIQ